MVSEHLIHSIIFYRRVLYSISSISVVWLFNPFHSRKIFIFSLEYIFLLAMFYILILCICLYIKKGLLHIIRNNVLKQELFLANIDDEASENENSSTLAKENIDDSPKDSFIILAEKLDTLQNLLLSEISDIKAEIKKMTNDM